MECKHLARVGIPPTKVKLCILLYNLILYEIYIFMKIIKLFAITLLSFCLTVGINILPPTLAQSLSLIHI